MVRTTTTKRDVAAEVTQMFIASLEKGRVPWHKPWQASGGSAPRSLSTGRPYRGTNSMLLGISSFDREYESPWWGTYRQIAEMGGQVKKGEKGTEVIFYKPVEKEDDTLEADGVKKSRGMLLRSFTVFNASQCTGLPEKYMKVEEDTRSDVERITECETVVEKFLANNGPKLNHDGGDRAFYSPSLDRVAMPTLNSFESPQEFYSTLFHELVHASGHKSRLNREGVVENHSFGDAIYSREELIAEMGAAMACANLGIDQTVTAPNSAAYVAGWLSKLQDADNKSLILQAAAGAQRAAEHIGALEIEYEITHEEGESITTDSPDVDLVAFDTPPTIAELESEIRYYRKSISMAGDPVKLAESDILDSLCQDRKLLGALQPDHPTTPDVAATLREHEEQYAIITSQVNNPLMRTRLIRDSQLAHVNDAVRLTDTTERLEARKEELLQLLYVEPHPWVGEIEDSGLDALLRTVEYRQRWKIDDPDNPLGESVVGEEQERERAALEAELLVCSMEQAGGLVR